MTTLSQSLVITEPPVSDLVEQEIALEDSMVSSGVASYRAMLSGNKEKVRESANPGSIAMLRAAVEPTAGLIQKFMDAANSGKVGRRHTAIKYLRMVDAVTAAFITAKTSFDFISRSNTLNAMSIAVGKAIEDEARFRKFNADKAALFQRLSDDLNSRTKSRLHKRRVLINRMGKAGVDWRSWTDRQRLLLGEKLLDLFRLATGLITFDTLYAGTKKHRVVVTATNETMQWLDEAHARGSLLSPRFLPMVIPPRDWTTVDDGGYIGGRIRRAMLVKMYNPNYLEELRNTEMPVVYDSINAIQRTAWKVNTGVLAFLQEAWDGGMDVGGIPSKYYREVPPKPRDIATNKDARTVWKRQASTVHTLNTRLRSKRIQLATTLTVAEQFAEFAAIYFPHTMDFRGRLYPTPMCLNPQGTDSAKALLVFAEGKPLGTEQAADWLAIHGANLYGEDKVSLSGRVAWVKENKQRILSAASDPFADLWWAEADKPWQFLAFCLEWAGYCREGLSFVSHIPIALDGSCNGLQHFSAMLRDPVGGEAVNLTPSAAPQDIYQRVCDRTVEKLRADIITNNTNTHLAQLWLEFGITRKTTKRPVMVLPYGGTLHACRESILEELDGRLETGDAHPFGEDIYKAASYLSKQIWESIGEVVIAARVAMSWLRGVAKVAANEGLPVNWTTPAGFPVLQAYPETKSHRVKTMIGDSLVYLSVLQNTDELNKLRQQQGISPNFVHSMDAAALQLCVVKAAGQGIKNFAMVHDSYGTLAADTQTLAVCLREAFVELYENNDVLEQFSEEVSAILSDGITLPAVPEKGTLDINSVLESDFFFA